MKTLFKKGDRVTVPNYCGVLVLDSIDEMLTTMLGKVHWYTISENYLQGRSKTNNGEVCSEDEMSHCMNTKTIQHPVKVGSKTNIGTIKSYKYVRYGFSKYRYFILEGKHSYRQDEITEVYNENHMPRKVLIS